MGTHLVKLILGGESQFGCVLLVVNLKNWIILVDRRGVGIEAWVIMEEQDMAAFEQDEEILGFASLNPNSDY